MTDSALSFPPALYGEATDEDPADMAVRRAIQGVDAGLVTYRLAVDRVGAALVFAPEVPLRQAMTMLPLCAVSLQNALGALAPPEVAVHLGWTGDVRINGGVCGGFRVAVSNSEASAVPDWMVVSWHLDLLSPDTETGHTPDRTTLYAEGCGDIAPPDLVQCWARYSLLWIARWEADGARALNAEWRALAHGLGAPLRIAGRAGLFLGVDEDFGMLLKDDETTHLLPLTLLLEDT